MNSAVSKNIIPVLVVTVCSVLAVTLSSLPVLETLEHKTIDARIRFRTPSKTFGKGLKLVLIDEPVMRAYPYRSPVSRDMLSKLVERIDGAGAKVIAMDIFLKGATEKGCDERLTQAIRKSGRVVLVSALRKARNVTTVELPDEQFLRAAHSAGLSDVPVDPFDQRIRRYRLSYTVDGKAVPTFAASVMKAASPAAIPDSYVQAGGRFFINYQRPFSSDSRAENIIEAVPASAVINENMPANLLKEWFGDRIVLIGAGFDDNPDACRTPFYSSGYGYVLMPGVEVHANALATLLSGQSIRILPAKTVFIIILFLAVFLCLVEKKLNIIAAGLLMLAGCAGYFVGALALFERNSVALPVVPVWLGLVLSYLGLTVYRSVTEGRQKKWVRNVFQMYLSPEFVNILLKDPGKLFLGGEEKEMTILFSDLEGFTSLSEKMAPTEVVSLLNEYLDGMTEIVMASGGTLDKYEGDAVMAFWNAPVDQPDHAVRAVTAALEMVRFSEKLSAEFVKAGRPAIRTRIGLNTGRVVVGNIGSKKRFNYTVIGDQVNLASRLEGANKEYKTGLMISDATCVLVKDRFVVRELDLIRVKGKDEPVKVYEVLGRIDESVSAARRDMLDAYNAGLAAYRRKEWNRAIACFEKALAAVPGDGPSSAYIDRCRYFLGNPPGNDWDGVFTLKNK